MAEGTQSLVKGKGSVCVGGLLLKSVLYVPNLKYSLLSMSKLSKDLDCIMTFFPSYCIFQDRSSGKMIGSAEEKDGLYCFSDNKHSPSQVPHSISLSVSLNSEILLWHRRLGHPSFQYLKHLYPDSFINKEQSVLNCDHFILAKQTHSSHQPNSHSFQTISFGPK